MYKMVQEGDGGDDPVAEALAFIRSLKLPPHQLQRLGLREDWAKEISPEFVQRVLELIAKHRKALEELAEY